ncbi:hypothetical protein AB0881_41630, partial [Spirillospora sp. NPDC029432]
GSGWRPRSSTRCPACAGTAAPRIGTGSTSPPPAAPATAPSAGEGPWAGDGPWSRDVRTGEFAAESSEVTGLLPKRVRQQSLAPQLRERPAPPGSGAVPDGGAREFDESDDLTGPGDPDDLDDLDDEPSPELSRDLMSSLQSGWARGRGPDDDDDDGGEDGGIDARTGGAEFEPHDERGER